MLNVNVARYTFLITIIIVRQKKIFFIFESKTQTIIKINNMLQIVINAISIFFEMNISFDVFLNVVVMKIANCFVVIVEAFLITLYIIITN